MRKENKKNIWEVKFSKEVLNKLEDLPDNIAEELEKIIIGLKNGKLDPKKIGQPIDWIELKIKLKCPKCDSKNVKWLLDKNSNEVTFNCLSCGEGFWMYYKEYKDAVNKNPNCVI